jgi:hypothetical protein
LCQWRRQQITLIFPLHVLFIVAFCSAFHECSPQFSVFLTMTNERDGVP